MRRLATCALTLLIAAASLQADCPGDLTGDNVVDQQDLGLLLAAYGNSDVGDFDGDGDTDQADLGFLLANFGNVCVSQPDGTVEVPAGEFAMGDHDGTGFGNERPVHDVYLDAFYLDIYEVSNQQYADFLNAAFALGSIEVTAGVVHKTADDEPYCDTFTSNSRSRIEFDGSTFTVVVDKEDHPMLLVSWYGAAAYANWLSEEDSRLPCYDLETWTCDFDADGFRLPTEAEWEYAARGGEHAPYFTFPWGSDIDGSMANFYLSGDPFEGALPETTPVGYYDGNQEPPGVDMANGYGAYDMAGNIWEWCNDWFDPAYYASSPYDNPQGPASGEARVLRGGSWGNDVVHLRCSYRISNGPEERFFYLGFRVVAKVE